MEVGVSTLVVKNLPDHLHEALRARARRNHRSLNKEAASIIEQAVHQGVVQPVQNLAVAKSQPLSMSELEAALADERYSHLDTLADVENLMDELRADRGEPQG